MTKVHKGTNKATRPKRTGGSTAGIGRGTSKYLDAAKKALTLLSTWLQQAGAYADSPASPPPDPQLLIACIEHWDVGIAKATVLTEAPRRLIAITLPKPRGEGTTERVLDPEALAYLLVLSLPGGRLVIEPHGPSGDYYYFRLVLTRQWRAYVLRLIVGTPVQRLTKAHHNYHRLERARLGGLVPLKKGQKAYHGRDHVEAGALARCRPEVGMSRQEYRTMIGRARRLLDAVPLGANGQSFE